jgi:GNAT superfamily N-acetyltransferase
MLTISPATTATDWQAAAALFREYAATLGNDICLVGFERELASLTTLYAPPDGALFLARAGADIAGVVGLRRLADACQGARQAEMKRLYVRPGWRGRGVGRGLALAAIERARELGCAAVALDTLDTMHEARTLYRQLGFVAYAPAAGTAAVSAPDGPAIHYMRLLL